MARFDELWQSVDGPGAPPALDSRRVKARVNAALDADRAERKIYMKQKWRTALIAAAAAAALTGSAFAATAGWNGLSSWFKGDASPVQEYVDSTARSVSDKDYTLTVEGAVADESTVYLTFTITALSDEAREFIHDDQFNSIDMLSTWAEPSAPGSDSDAERPMTGGSCSYRELECADEDSRRFTVEVDSYSSSAPVDTLFVRCGYMEKDKRVEVPLAPAPSVTVKVGASGDSVLYLKPVDIQPITIQEVTLTPFTCHIQAKGPDLSLRPRILLRMADGTIRTQAQMMTGNSSSFDEVSRQRVNHYRFKEIQDLDSIASIIVFDMEYPLDGSKPTPVEHDPALDPITAVTRMEPLSEESGYSIPARELTEKLGGNCAWDAATGSVTCEYRGVAIVLRAGDQTALVDGEAVEMPQAPAVQDGVLAAPWSVFTDAWGIDGAVLREYEGEGDEMQIIWGDWYIIP